MFCSKCGNKLEDEALFCAHCGAKVIKETSEPVEEVKLNKIEPKPIKTATETEKKQNEEEVKGMFFKKVEVSKELLDELKDAEVKEAKNANVDKPVENAIDVSEQQANAGQADENVANGKRVNFIKRVIGDKVSDANLDVPVWKLKPVIFGSLALAAMLVLTIILVVFKRTDTSMHINRNGVNNYTYYDQNDMVSSYDETNKKSSNKVRKNGWDGDYYYKNDVIVTNDWAQYGDDWYYLGPNGVIVSGYQVIDGANYYFDVTGKMLINSFTPDSAHYAGPDGRLTY